MSAIHVLKSARALALMIFGPPVIAIALAILGGNYLPSLVIYGLAGIVACFAVYAAPWSDKTRALVAAIYLPLMVFGMPVILLIFACIFRRDCV